MNGINASNQHHAQVFRSSRPPLDSRNSPQWSSAWPLACFALHSLRYHDSFVLISESRNFQKIAMQN